MGLKGADVPGTGGRPSGSAQVERQGSEGVNGDIGQVQAVALTHAGEKFEIRILGCWGGDDGEVDGIRSCCGGASDGSSRSGRRCGRSSYGRESRGLGPGDELGGEIAMANGLPLRQSVIVAARKAEGVGIAKLGEEIAINVVVDSGGRASSTTLDGDVGLTTGEDVVDRGERELALNKQSGARAMTAGIDGVIVGRVSRGGAARQTGGSRGKPQRVVHTRGRRVEDVVVYGYVRNGVLKEDVSGYIDAKVAVEGVAVNRAAAYPAAILPPNVDAIVMIGVIGRIPISEVVEVIVVDAVVGTSAYRAGSQTVIDVIDIGILQREITAVTSDGPGGIVTGDVVHGQIIGEMPVHTIDRMSRRKIRGRGTDI